MCVRAAPPASFLCVDVALIDVFPPCDIEQSQRDIQLYPPKEPPSRADPVSETRQGAVKSRRFGRTDVHCRCAGMTLVENVCSEGGENLGPCRAWPPLAQAADIYIYIHS